MANPEQNAFIESDILQTPPAQYFPLKSPRYNVGLGLYRWGTDLGNGPVDQRIFQIDSQYNHFRDNLLSCREENFRQYHGEDKLPGEIAEQVLRFMGATLAQEYPQQFRFEESSDHNTLYCALTGDVLHFDGTMTLLTDSKNPDNIMPFYQSALDAIACQIPEDLAIIRRNKSQNSLCAVHCCCPNQWAPASKLGKSFASMHKPIPGFSDANPQPMKLVDAMIERGPFVRFAWGINRGSRLNRYPGSDCDDKDEDFYLRVERQTTHGFANIDAALFTIRTYLYPLQDICKIADQRELLKGAIQSMTDQALAYKGLTRHRETLLELLSDQVT